MLNFVILLQHITAEMRRVARLRTFVYIVTRLIFNALCSKKSGSIPRNACVACET